MFCENTAYQKKAIVVWIDKKVVAATKKCDKIENEHQQNTNVSTAIKGTNSALNKPFTWGKSEFAASQMHRSGWLQVNCP